jgi:hypothetical protein
MSAPSILKKLQQEFESRPQTAAKKIVEDYFSYVNAGQVQEKLWELTQGTLTNQLLDTQTAMDRHNTLFFYEYSKLFISAVYYLYGNAAR